MQLRSLFTAAVVSGLASAQVPPAIPYTRSLDLYVVDPNFDGVWRFQDLNQDGDWHDPGEVVVFYDDATGSIMLTNPATVVSSPDGTVYLADTTLDIVVALRDDNGNGHANDPGEHRVFFSQANQSGINLGSVQGITVDAIGRLFLAVANTSSSGPDMILQLIDLNADGDAEDAGEAIVYCLIPGAAASTGASIPTKVAVGPDLAVYYTEVGSTGAIQKGVWRLFDGNGNGHCNDPGERTLYWTPPFVASPFYYGLAFDRFGAIYVTDHSSNEQVWRAFDANQNGVIDVGEETLFYQTTASTWWDVVVRDDGAILLCEDQTPDRVTVLRDVNLDGDALDPGEAYEGYDSSTHPIAVRPRGACINRAPLLFASPATVPIGQTTTLTASASKPGELCAIALSVGIVAAVPLPPWGMLEVDPSAFVFLGFGLADTQTQFSVPLAIPPSPMAIGSYGLQAWCGDQVRFFLSNGVPLLVTP
jgi:hypothetical protein